MSRLIVRTVPERGASTDAVLAPAPKSARRRGTRPFVTRGGEQAWPRQGVHLRSVLVRDSMTLARGQLLVVAAAQPACIRADAAGAAAARTPPGRRRCRKARRATPPCSHEAAGTAQSPIRRCGSGLTDLAMRACGAPIEDVVVSPGPCFLSRANMLEVPGPAPAGRCSRAPRPTAIFSMDVSGALRPAVVGEG